jgi:hypothetical protein
MKRMIAATLFGLLSVSCDMGLSGEAAEGSAAGVPAGRGAAGQAPALYEYTVVPNNCLIIHSLAAADNEWGAAWTNTSAGGYPEIYFTRINKFGVKIGPDVPISKQDDYDSSTPAIVWSGKEYGVAWKDSSDSYPEIHFARVSPEGEKIHGSEKRVSSDDDCYSGSPALAWNQVDGEYAIVWEDHRNGSEIYFARVRDGLKVRNSEKRISGSKTGNAYLPSIVWNPNDQCYAVSFLERQYTQMTVDVVLIDKTGEIEYGPRAFWGNAGYGSMPVAPSIAWGGSNYGIVCQADKSLNGGTEVYFARVDRKGELIEKIKQLSRDDGDESSHPVIEEYNGYYYVFWTDWLSGVGQIYCRVINKDGIAGSERHLTSNDNRYVQSVCASLKLNVDDVSFLGISFVSYTRPKQQMQFMRIDTALKKIPCGGLTGELSGTQHGEFYIRNRHYGTYLTSLGSSVYMKPYNYSYISAHMWYLSDEDKDGWYELVNRATGKKIKANLDSDGNFSADLSMADATNGSWLGFWDLYPYDDEGGYLLTIRKSSSDPLYRICPVDEENVRLNRNSAGSKIFELIPAGD